MDLEEAMTHVAALCHHGQKCDGCRQLAAIKQRQLKTEVRRDLNEQSREREAAFVPPEVVTDDQ